MSYRSGKSKCWSSEQNFDERAASEAYASIDDVSLGGGTSRAGHFRLRGCELVLYNRQLRIIMLRSSMRLGTARLPNPCPLIVRSLKSTQTILPRNTKRAASTVTHLDNFPKVGEKLHGFTIYEKKHVPELHLTAVWLKHDQTEADYMHVARDDKNNVFGIGFKTNPPDATGVPHILEHTTLCGSEK